MASSKGRRKASKTVPASRTAETRKRVRVPVNKPGHTHTRGRNTRSDQKRRAIGER